MSVVTTDEDGPLLCIGVNRPEANNLWNLEVIQAVSRAYRRLADVSEVVPADAHLARAIELARLVAANAPLAVQAALASARAAESAARDAARTQRAWLRSSSDARWAPSRRARARR